MWPLKRVKVKGANDEGGSRVLRIGCPGHSAEEGLEGISEKEFLGGCEENSLMFLYQEETKAGEDCDSAFPFRCIAAK